MKPVALILLTLLAAPVLAGEGAMVNYVSADGVYVNVGRRGGLVPGTRITVLREGARIAVLEAVRVSSHSASCRVLEKSADPRAGDRISFQPADVAPSSLKPDLPEVRTVPASSTPALSDRNRVRGYLSLQHMWIRDQSGSGLTTLQPAVSGRFVVSNLMGTTGQLSVRHRSRLYYRPETGEKTWSHRLSELAVRFGEPSRGLAYGFGRFVVDDVHGLGYVDGAFAAVQISPHYRAGVVAGLSPDGSTGGFQPGSRKFGSFVGWHGLLLQRHRLALTAAISGSYVDGTVDREFGYVQAVYDHGGKIHLYQSFEVDMNRQWRQAANGGRLTFSNFLTSITANPHPAVALDFSYDARQSVRDYNTFETPDSLFDDNLYTGVGGGVSVRVGRGVQLRANGGLRYRDSNDETNRYYTLTGTARNLPMPGHSATVRWAVSQTPFVTAHRPTISYRFPVGRRLRLDAGAGGYFYTQGITESRTYFLDAGAYYTFRTRYYFSGDLRQYVGGGLESFQLLTEAGISF